MSNEIKQKEIVGELSLSAEILTDIDLNSLDLSDKYLPLSGGTVNGNININDGNFVQTTDNYTKVYGRNSFIQAETVLKDDGITPKYQQSSAGSRGYIIIGINYDKDTDTKLIKLSGDISELSNNINSTSFSYALANSSGVDAIKILSVDYTTNNEFGWISVDTLPTVFIDNKDQKEDYFITQYKNDDNGLFAISDSTIGNTILENFYGQHAEGGSVKAIGRYSHAEGRRTIVGNRYAHGEGDGCKALGQASHAEGMNNTVKCLYAHAEGEQNTIQGNATAAHVEGGNNEATGDAAHVGGRRSKASGNQAFAHGVSVNATSDYSVALGYLCDAPKRGFTWSGVNSTKRYSPTAEGSFSINPTGGTKGFYIGAESLNNILSNLSVQILEALGK